jgi:hypothetical protein
LPPSVIHLLTARENKLENAFDVASLAETHTERGERVVTAFAVDPCRGEMGKAPAAPPNAAMRVGVFKMEPGQGEINLLEGGNLEMIRS